MKNGGHSTAIFFAVSGMGFIGGGVCYAVRGIGIRVVLRSLVASLPLNDSFAVETDPSRSQTRGLPPDLGDSVGMHCKSVY